MLKKAIAILIAVTMFPVSCFAGGGVSKYSVNLLGQDPVSVPSEVIYSLRQLDDSPLIANSKIDFNHDGEMDASVAIQKNETSVLQRLSGADKLTQDYTYHFSGRKYDEIAFQLCQPVTGIQLNFKTLSMVAGSSCVLKAAIEPKTAANQSIIWTSSDESVATVNAGLVKAISSGNAVITATTMNGGLSASCKIEVYKKDNPAMLIPTNITVTSKETMVSKPKFTCVLKDNSGNRLAKKKVIITLNKQRYTVKTNAKGIASIHFKAKKGRYQGVVEYKGSSKYQAYKKKFVIKVLSAITIYAPTIKKTAEKATIKVLLKSNGKVLTGKKVKIAFYKTTYIVKTNQNGIAKVTIPERTIKKLEAGAHYKISAIYNNEYATAFAAVVK